MLQSPLTRKSSRNASRTQTPTNSNSPVPSLGHDTQFRQKVLDELEKQSGKSSTPGNSSSNTTGERRLSRKGSGASRSSRSRSSPRIANRPNTSSSDEGRAILHQSTNINQAAYSGCAMLLKPTNINDILTLLKSHCRFYISSHSFLSYQS